MQLDRIIQMAKDHTLKHGQLMPEIIIELDTQETHILACPDIVESDSSTEKQHRFFTAGRILSESNPDKNIASIAFMGEGWGSFNRDVRPSCDPDRKECLSIATLDVIKKEDSKRIEQNMYVYEMIRDESGKIIDLLRINLEHGNTHSPVL